MKKSANIHKSDPKNDKQSIKQKCTENVYHNLQSKEIR